MPLIAASNTYPISASQATGLISGNRDLAVKLDSWDALKDFFMQLINLLPGVDILRESELLATLFDKSWSDCAVTLGEADLACHTLEGLTRFFGLYSNTKADNFTLKVTHNTHDEKTLHIDYVDPTHPNHNYSTHLTFSAQDNEKIDNFLVLYTKLDDSQGHYNLDKDKLDITCSEIVFIPMVNKQFRRISEVYRYMTDGNQKLPADPIVFKEHGSETSLETSDQPPFTSPLNQQLRQAETDIENTAKKQYSDTMLENVRKLEERLKAVQDRHTSYLPEPDWEEKVFADLRERIRYPRYDGLDDYYKTTFQQLIFKKYAIRHQIYFEQARLHLEEGFKSSVCSDAWKALLAALTYTDQCLFTTQKIKKEDDKIYGVRACYSLMNSAIGLLRQCINLTPEKERPSSSLNSARHTINRLIARFPEPRALYEHLQSVDPTSAC